MKIETKERTKVEYMLETGDLGDKPMASINLMVRYYKNLGKEKEEIYNILDNFLSKNLSLYNKVTWYDKIQDVLKSKYEVDLCEIENIKITKDEILEIKKVKLKYQKILFSMLVYLKILRKKNNSETLYINSTKYITDIYNEANVSSSKETRIKELKELENLGYVERSLYKRIVQGKVNISIMYKLLYIKEETPENPVEMVIDDFRELGLQWLEYNGDKKIKCCEVCGKRIKIAKTGRPSLYCKECKEDKDRNCKLKYWKKTNKK